MLNLLVLSHLIKCLNRPDKTEKWDFKKKKEEKMGRKLVLTCSESPLTQQPRSGRGRRRERMFYIPSTADMLLARKPPESSGIPPSPTSRTGWGEEGEKGADRIIPPMLLNLAQPGQARLSSAHLPPHFVWFRGTAQHKGCGTPLPRARALFCCCCFIN